MYTKEKRLEFEKKRMEQEQEERDEIERNPLSAYSTTQLKAEIRRRKENKW